MHKRNLKTNQVDPERPATYVAQSRTPDSNKAFITPAKPIMARKPPPEPAMAITGTFNTQEETQRHVRCTLLYHYCLYFFLLCNLWRLHRECATPVESHLKHLGFQLFHHFCCTTSCFCICWSVFFEIFPQKPNSVQGAKMQRSARRQLLSYSSGASGTC